MVYVYTAFAIILLAIIVFVSMKPPTREGLVATDESMRKMFVDTYKVVDNSMHGLEKMNLNGNLHLNGADAKLCIDGVCLTKGDIAKLQKTQADEQVFPYEGTWYSRKIPNYGFRFTKTSSGIKATYMNGSAILVNDFGYLKPSGNGYVMPSNSSTIVWKFTSPSTATYAAFGMSQDTLFIKK